MPISLDRLREKPHLSVSALKTWLSCPRKFCLRYVEGATASHRSIALAFGHAWHDLLGYVLLAHQRGREPSLAELREHFASALEHELNADAPPVLFEDDEDVPQLIQMAMHMLEAFLAAVRLPERLLHVELPFTLEIVDPATGEVGSCPLIGAIDAVVATPRAIELWELKSGKKRWTQDAVAFDFQPTAYRMAMRSMTKGNPEQVDLKLIVTTKSEKPDVQVEELVRTPLDERELMETAVSIQRAVRSGCFHPVRSWMCKQCEYADACSRWA